VVVAALIKILRPINSSPGVSNVPAGVSLDLHDIAETRCRALQPDKDALVNWVTTIAASNCWHHANAGASPVSVYR
jgi:hypothetical protein